MEDRRDHPPLGLGCPPSVKAVPGFTTLLAVAVLVLSLGLIAALVYSVREGLERQKSQSQGIVEAAALRAHLLVLLDQGWPAPSSPAAPQGWEIRVEDLSGRIDLNSVPLEVLRSPALSGSLKKPSEAFQEYRVTEGPFPSLNAFGDWIDLGTWPGVFRTVSLLNPNAVDPAMLERYVTRRSSSPAKGAEVRAKVESIRREGLTMDQTQLTFLLGSEEANLGPLLRLEGSVNVNVAPVAVLEAVILGTTPAVPSGPTKIGQIVLERQERPLTQERLRNLLAVDPRHRVYSFLGTRSRFYQIQYQRGSDVLEAWIFDDSTNESPRWRIIERRGPW